MQTASVRNLKDTWRFFAKNSFLAEVVEADPGIFLPRLEITALPFNHTIYDDGDFINSIYFPIDSLISSFAILGDGSRVEICMIGKEAIAGMPAILGSNPNRFCTRMSFGGTVAKLDAEVIQYAFASNVTIMRMLLRACESQITQISQRSVCNARHHLMERFCCWLLMVQDRLGSSNLRLTQELIASRLGTRRAGVTVAARTLYDEGAIDYKRGLLRIKNRAAIEAKACECYLVLKPQDNGHQQSGLNSWSSERAVDSPLAQLTRKPLPRLRDGQPLVRSQ